VQSERTVADETIRIDGLTDFRRALGKIDRALGKRIGQINKATGEKVASKARAAYSNFYTTRRGRVPKSIKSSAAQREVKISLGRESVPYALGQEFGSNKHRQFFPWTGPSSKGGSAGRFFYPAIREETPGLVDDYLKALDEVAREAYPS
jgi:hypothetical protein